MQTHRHHLLWLRFGLAALLVLSGVGAVSPAAVSSKDIVKLSGVDHGLCVLLGCGGETSPALAADLASSGKMLVHGMALDGASLTRARKAVTAAGADGFASIERLPANPLAYRDNVANLVVIEDVKASTSAGLTMKEALRITAPGGKVCACRGGKWTVTIKRRPKGMDEWTHIDHGPDGSRVSRDRVVEFPFGLRWNAGLPMNISNPKREANQWSTTRGMALTNGRCFTLSESVLENLAGAHYLPHGMDQYVTARDAYNGLFLWRRKVGAVYYGGLYLTNRAPFVAVGDRVYTAMDNGKLVALDAATGKVARTYPSDYIPGRLLLDRDTLVAAEWKEGAKVGGEHGIDRRRMEYRIAEGAVEGFDAKSGRKLWSLGKLATSLVSADGVVYMVQRGGADPREEFGPKKRRGVVPTRPGQKVVAVNLRSGKELWSVGTDVLGAGDALYVDAAGLGAVAVSHDNAARMSVLSAKDGKVLLQAKKNAYPAFYQGAIHIGGTTYDPKSGKVKGQSALNFHRTVCTPPYYVNGILVNNRGGGYVAGGKHVYYGGMRGGCLFSSPAANGAMYSPQNWCGCSPGQIEGLVSIGPVGELPTAEEVEKAPVVERGPAYGKVSGASDPNDWPLYRRDAARSNATSSAAPSRLDVLWQKTLAAPAGAGPVATNWREFLIDPLTAPVVAEGVVVTAAPDRHEVIALAAESGKELWRRTVGGRVDSSPTIHRGACLFGSHDGYVYSLSCKDGQLAWRLRAAPRESRLVSYGQIESPWPAIGTVLVADGTAYASAGRTAGSDGGIAVRAFDPATGKARWSRALTDSDRGAIRRNDLMLSDGRAIQLMVTRMDPRTGEIIPKPKPKPKARGKSAAKPKLPDPKKVLALARKGEAPAGKALAELAEKPKPPAPKPPKKLAPRPAPTTGLEGFICWNWTRLGDRRYRQMRLGGVAGHMLSWDDTAVCSNQQGRIIRFQPDRPAPDTTKSKPRGWTVNLPGGFLANCIVVCRDAVVVGGGVYKPDSKDGQGFVWVLSREKGRKTAEFTYRSPLAYNGIAVVDGRAYAAFADGTIACLAEKKAP